MSSEESANSYAAVDLGSNSFHLVVARREHGELRFLDSIKEMVQLAGGLDGQGNLDITTRAGALDCLARFGQRLRGIPAANIRAVGTQALRRMRKANAFLMVAETALGCPVEIIGGREEARLIYMGVSQGVSGFADRRLVMDIGGGSTELIIGDGPQPIELESLQFGCVVMSRRYFPGGRITARRFEKARLAVRAELQELEGRYQQLGWDSVIGSSGTIRAAFDYCQARGWCEERLEADALFRLRDELIRIGHCDAIDPQLVTDRRRPVFAGGVAILVAAFESLGLRQLRVSPFALREGVLHDLLGRLEHRDPRAKTVQAFKARYGVDLGQAERVGAIAQSALAQLDPGHRVNESLVEFLGWAADLHETGLAVSHSHYQEHSGYLVQRSDMAGFTQQEQTFLAALVRFHRREIPSHYSEGLPPRFSEPLRLLLFCLRLACILCRTRATAGVPGFQLLQAGESLRVQLPVDWARGHPLTLADLQLECTQARVLGLNPELVLVEPSSVRA